MKQTGEPIVLTVNGKAEVVVQYAKSYQQLLETIEKLEAISLRHGFFARKTPTLFFSYRK